MSSSRPRNASQRLLNLRSYGLISPGWLVGRHLFLLAVLRYNDLPAENVSGLSKGQVIGHSLEVTAGFGLLHVDCLEEESFSFHVHRSTRPLWVSRRIWTSMLATVCKREKQ